MCIACQSEEVREAAAVTARDIAETGSDMGAETGSDTRTDRRPLSWLRSHFAR